MGGGACGVNTPPGKRGGPPFLPAGRPGHIRPVRPMSPSPVAWARSRESGKKAFMTIPACGKKRRAYALAGPERSGAFRDDPALAARRRSEAGRSGRYTQRAMARPFGPVRMPPGYGWRPADGLGGGRMDRMVPVRDPEKRAGLAGGHGREAFPGIGVESPASGVRTGAVLFGQTRGHGRVRAQGPARVGPVREVKQVEMPHILGYTAQGLDHPAHQTSGRGDGCAEEVLHGRAAARAWPALHRQAARVVKRGSFRGPRHPGDSSCRGPSCPCSRPHDPPARGGSR
jgi:hypothetical protein